jgi:iron complex transport system permease protein
MSPLSRLLAALSALGLAVVALSLGALFIGSAPVSPRAVLAVLGGRGAAASVDEVVVWSLRLPRILAALLAGGALAVAGVGFQGLTRNPLAEPSVLGVSSGAAFGVVMAQVFGLHAGLLDTLGLTAFAFAGAFAAGTAVYAIAARAGGLPVHTLVLAGVIVGIFFASAITVLISVVDFDRLGGVIHWLLGNLAPLPGVSLGLFALVTALGFWLVLGQSRQLNLLALGEEGALQLGVDAERVKRRIFAGAALLTGAVVAFVGPIGFVGLIVPHALRLVLGPDHRVLVPTALLGGGLFLLAADTLARNLIAPAELSVGVITSFCGAPFFVYLLRTRYQATL